MSVRVYSKRHPIPEGAKTRYVGRPGRWGNPFIVGKDGSLDDVLGKYAIWLCDAEQRDFRELVRRELAGVDLVCWCAPYGGIDADAEPLICHAQILARITNNSEP